MRPFLDILLWQLLLVSCSASEYSVTAPQPILNAEAPASAETNRPFIIDVSVQQNGFSGNFALSVILLEGQATMMLDGKDISMGGEWISLAHHSEKLTITPAIAGAMRIRLQAKSVDGSLSENQTLSFVIKPAPKIEVKIDYPKKLINPVAASRIPIAFEIAKQGYKGDYIIKATVSKGEGVFFHEGHAVNDMNFSVKPSSIIEFCPDILGEHVVDFTISAEADTATMPAYVEVIKNITVSSAITDCFSITQTGQHTIDSKKITLSLENKPGYNFKIAGWYDGDKLLSTAPTYPITLSKSCISTLHIKLTQRPVSLSLGDITNVENPFYILVNGELVLKPLYDSRIPIRADYKATETIKFFHTAYYYYIYSLPQTRMTETVVKMEEGTDWAEYFYRIDKKFNIFLRRSDNPGFVYNIRERYMDSPSTRYYIPTNITIQD